MWNVYGVTLTHQLEEISPNLKKSIDDMIGYDITEVIKRENKEQLEGMDRIIFYLRRGALTKGIYDNLLSGRWPVEEIKVYS